MDLTPGPAEGQERSEEPRLTSFVTKMIGHQRTMAAGLVAVTTGMEQIATGYEALCLDVEQIRAAAYRAGREDAAKAIEDFRLGASDFGEIFLEHAVKGCRFWEVQVGGSDDGSPRMELDSVLEAACEHIRTGHNTERGSE